MLTNNTKDYIRLYLSSLYSQPDLERGISYLEKYLEFISWKYNDKYEDVLNEYSTASVLEQKNRIKALIDIECFLGQLAEILELKNNNNIVLDSDIRRGNTTNPQWTMERYYKIAFKLFPRSFNLSTESVPETNIKRDKNGKKYHFLNLYYYRNRVDAHFNKDTNKNTLTATEVYGFTESMLFVMVYLMLKYQNDLEIVYKKESQDRNARAFDIYKYENGIVRDYERNKAFEYLDTKWDFEADASTSKTITEIINENYSNEIIAFIGEAGTGKTTALKRLEYEYAKNSPKDSFENLPIYIELIKLRTSNSALIKGIAERLQLSEDTAKGIVNNEAIVLFLDGFNEISNRQFASSIKTEVEGILKANNKLRLFITDRTEDYLLFNSSQATSICKLHALSMEDKRDFFKKNSKSDAAFNIINEQINSELNEITKPIIRGLKTPYMLSVFLLFVEEYRSIPNSPMKNYIEKLFEREEQEHKDRDDPDHFKEMKKTLALIACKYEADDFSSTEAEQCIGRIKSIMGYSSLDSVECIELSVKMGLLENTNTDRLRFKSKEIKDYFINFADIEGLTGILR